MSTENKYQFKGTQGEWLFVQTQSIGRSIDESDFNIAVWDNSKGRYDTFVNCWNERCNIGFDTNKEQAKANAHLISAAPELLQACIEVLSSLNEADDVKGYWSEEQKVLQSAIHKALNIQD